MDLEMRKQDVSTQRGLTLIEILVALSILALAVLALAPLFTGAIRTNASSNQLTTANTLAREKLEELSGYPRNDPRLTIVDGSNAAAPTGVSVSTAPGATPSGWVSWANDANGFKVVTPRPVDPNYPRISSALQAWWMRMATTYGCMANWRRCYAC